MKKILIFTLFIISLSFLICQNVWAIGQITEPIVIKDVLRGQTIQETLILYGSEEKDEVYGLIAEGDIKDWTTFYLPDDIDFHQYELRNPIQEVKIPAQSRPSVIAQFKLPDNIPNGVYTGVIGVFSLPTEEKEEEGVSTSVRLRVDREVSITVTDQEIIKFEATVIPLKYGVKKGEPLKIKVIYDNQGNVAIKPDIQLKILKDEQIVFNAIFPYPENEKAVKPFERKEFPDLIEWQTTGQESGIYKAEIEVLLNDEVYQEEDFKFSLGLIGFWPGLVRGIKDINLKIFWPIIGLVAVILANVMLGLFIKKNLKK